MSCPLVQFRLRGFPPLLISFLLLVLSAQVGVCQALPIGIDSYAFVHPFGLASATTTRQFGMGGPISCVGDLGFGNPAFAATQKSANANLRLSLTDFERGPELVSTHLSAAYPLAPEVNGLQLSLFSLHSNSGSITVPQVGQGVIELSEEDISLHYGHRIRPRLTAGIGLSPFTEIELALGAQGGPRLMNIKAEADIGARLGLAYEKAPGQYLGLVYDYYQETIQATGVAGSVRRVFHTDLLALGISHHVVPRWLVVAEYQRGRSFDGPTRNSLCGWHLGAEYHPLPAYALRAGLNDGRLNLGIGYAHRGWRVDYAFMNRWNDDIARGLFGGSDTHQLQVIAGW